MVFKDFERRGFVKLFPMPEDKRNKVIRFTKAGKEYADIIVSELKNVLISCVRFILTSRFTEKLHKQSHAFV